MTLSDIQHYTHQQFKDVVRITECYIQEKFALGTHSIPNTYTFREEKIRFCLMTNYKNRNSGCDFIHLKIYTT
jgi:hypothetical protein